jgi:hypothetical protein
MHSFDRLFAIDRSKPIMTSKKVGYPIKPGKQLSKIDVQGIKNLYECKPGNISKYFVSKTLINIIFKKTTLIYLIANYMTKQMVSKKCL